MITGGIIIMMIITLMMMVIMEESVWVPREDLSWLRQTCLLLHCSCTMSSSSLSSSSSSSSLSAKTILLLLPNRDGHQLVCFGQNYIEDYIEHDKAAVTLASQHPTVGVSYLLVLSWYPNINSILHCGLYFKSGQRDGLMSD